MAISETDHERMLAQRAAETAKFETEYTSKVRLVNDFCLKYGCFFELSRMSGADAEDLIAYVSDPQRTTDANSDIYARINEWFTAICYNPFHRAYFVYRAQRTPYFSEFSHHIERGLLHYYKGDYFSAAQVLLPAVEGILRLYVGGGPMEVGKGLVDKIQTTLRTPPYPHFGERYAASKYILDQFLREWIFARSDNPNLASIPSNMNRNYVLHLAGSDSFYRPADCNRLFAFFDVMIEVVTLEHKEVEEFIGMDREGIPEVEARQQYYGQFIFPWTNWRLVREAEEDFMAQNPRYERTVMPDHAGLLATQHLQRAADMQKIIEGEIPEARTIPPKPYARPAQNSESRTEILKW